MRSTTAARCVEALVWLVLSLIAHGTLRVGITLQKKPLLQKKEAPKELAQAGDPLAQSMDELLDMF